MNRHYFLCMSVFSHRLRLCRLLELGSPSVSQASVPCAKDALKTVVGVYGTSPCSVLHFHPFKSGKPYRWSIIPLCGCAVGHGLLTTIPRAKMTKRSFLVFPLHTWLSSLFSVSNKEPGFVCRHACAQQSLGCRYNGAGDCLPFLMRKM